MTPDSKVSSVSPEQFSLIRQTTSQFPRGLGKPRFFYFGTTGLLITKWPSRLHEKPIQTVDEILSQKGTNLPYTRDLVIAQINHNTGLVVEEDTIIIPNVSLEFGANDDLLDPIYPVICQVAFSQTFQDARKEIKILVNTYSSLCMGIVIDIKEELSKVWKTLSQESYMSFIPFLDRSSICQVPSTEGFSTEPFIVCGHTWCSIKEVEYHVWVKAPGSDRLHLDAEPGDNYVSCRSPGDIGQDNVKAMLLRELCEVKQSVISFCEMIICNAKHSPIDLTPLHSHTSILLISLESFNRNIAKGIKVTSHSQYGEWFSKLSRGLKYSRDAGAVAAAGAFRLRCNQPPPIVDDLIACHPELPDAPQPSLLEPGPAANDQDGLRPAHPCHLPLHFHEGAPDTVDMPLPAGLQNIKEVEENFDLANIGSNEETAISRARGTQYPDTLS
ncbi:hypothetical protein V8E55_001067 [Tylopilus felleus]